MEICTKNFPPQDQVTFQLRCLYGCDANESWLLPLILFLCWHLSVGLTLHWHCNGGDIVVFCKKVVFSDVFWNRWCFLKKKKLCFFGIVGFYEMLLSKEIHGVFDIHGHFHLNCLFCTCVEYCGKKSLDYLNLKLKKQKQKMFWIFFRLLLKYGKPQLKGFVNVATSKTIYTWQEASNSLTHYHFEESALAWLSSHFYDEYKQYNQSLRNKTQIAEMFQDIEIPNSFVLSLFPKMQTNTDLDSFVLESHYWHKQSCSKKNQKQFQNKTGHICDQSLVILNQGDNSCFHKCPWPIAIPVWHTCSQHSCLPGITA